MPDHLRATLHGLAVICADLEYRREVFLLEAEHVASMPISLELHAESVRRHLAWSGSATFSELIGPSASPETIVVTLLAVLELYKRGQVDVTQDATFGEIVVRKLSEQEAAERRMHEEEL
jgi:segregation and condensation protein A